MALREFTIKLQAQIRTYLAKKQLERRRKAAHQIRFFIKGFITRNEAPNECNRKFIEQTKRIWLQRLAQNLPTNFMNHVWPPAPVHCTEASEHLEIMHKNYLKRAYRKALSVEKKRQFDLKVLAETAFKDKKKSYPHSVGPWFIDERCAKDSMTQIGNFVSTQFGQERLMYSTPVVKYDRHGYKPRKRFFLLSNKAIYLLDDKFKSKHRLPLEKVDVCVTNSKDKLLLIRIPLELKQDKGDLILEVPELIECCVWIIDVTKRQDIVQILDTNQLSHNLVSGKGGVIEIQTGSAPSIMKAKSGNLLVVSWVLISSLIVYAFFHNSS